MRPFSPLLDVLLTVGAAQACCDVALSMARLEQRLFDIAEQIPRDPSPQSGVPASATSALFELIEIIRGNHLNAVIPELLKTALQTEMAVRLSANRPVS